MPEEQEAVGVVIVSWNVRDLLLECLVSLRESRRPLRIVVVDNASQDGTGEAVALQHPHAQVLANTENAGYTRAINQGLRHLGVLSGDGSGAPPVVVLLNPDTQVRHDALSDLADFLDAHPRAAVAGPALLWPDGTVQSSRRRFPTVATGLFESTPLEWHWPHNPAVRRLRMEDEPQAAGQVDWLSGAVLAVRSDALREMGGMDEGYFMYSEEMDLCRRLADAGWQTHYVPAALVVHHEGQSSDQAVPARHLNFHRSRIRYFRKHHGPLAAAVVRAGVLAGYVVEAVLEFVKLLLGHRAPLRRQRLKTYRAVLADRLRPMSTSQDSSPGGVPCGS